MQRRDRHHRQLPERHPRACSLDALPESDFTAKALIDGLPAGQDIFYRVALPGPVGADDHRRADGRTLPHRARPTGARCRSSGRATPPARAGASTRRAAACGPTRPCAGHRPDFFIHSGDTIYADGPIEAEVKLPDGTVWKNLVIEEKLEGRRDARPSSAATTNTICSTGICAPSTPRCRCSAQWDDHEVTNNWSPSKSLDARTSATREKNVPLLAARAARAFHEFMPIARDAAGGRRASIARSPTGRCSTCSSSTCAAIAARTPTTRRTRAGRRRYSSAATQLAWLKRELINSRATWKVIAADMPLGLIVYDDAGAKKGSEAIAQGDGPALGRELEIRRPARPSSSTPASATPSGSRPTCITPRRTITIPDKAEFQDFEPFWEFVSGPLHAGTVRPERARQHLRAAAALRQGAGQGRRRRTCRRATACSSSATWRSTARPR